MRLFNTIVVFTMCISGYVGRCLGSDKVDASAAEARFFETRIRPLLANRCFKCHSAKKQKGGLRLDTRAFLLRGGENGPAVKPGDPENSLLFRAVNYRQLEMPPDEKLNKADTMALRRWIAAGALWPNSAKNSHTVRKADQEISPADLDFWSLRPVTAPAPPQHTLNPWCGNPIDGLILQKLQQHQLSPSREASPRELIRRLYFDLTGLPPNPQQVHAFLRDERPDAWRRLVDQLLGSPHYGERWGRHWLDVVRFAQTDGYERDNEKPESWRYRDYVIRAFNADKAYNRFIVEQLAGDELTDPTFDAIIATGFYRLGVWDDEPDDKQAAIFEEMDDVLRTLGETFLGSTIGCARCHDHKFDPIPQEDYYRMLAFVRNVLPVGKDKSATHWEVNHDAVFTPLMTGGQFRDRQARQANIDLRIQELQARATTATAAQKQKLETEIAKLKSERGAAPPVRALSVRESGPEAPETHLLIRGNHLTPGPRVAPGFLSVLGGQQPEFSPPADDSHGFRKRLRTLGVQSTTGRRLALAKWIASADHPLTARVMVNRLWHYHFGTGIVSTPNDFGRAGQLPSHPELLDWLAAELIRSEWSIKHIHRLILTSRTYRQTSRHGLPAWPILNTANNVQHVDPDNRLLWRQNLRRLDAEAIRDGVLSVSGSLNLQMYGRGAFPELQSGVLATQSLPGNGWDKQPATQRWRRSVYVFVKRTLGVPFLETLDMPTPDTSAPTRTTTTIAPQALILLNSQFINSQSAIFADRIRRESGTIPRAQIQRAFQLALGRDPDDQDVNWSLEFLAGRRSPLGKTHKQNEVTDPQRLTQFCRMLLNLNEFLYVD